MIGSPRPRLVGTGAAVIGTDAKQQPQKKVGRRKEATSGWTKCLVEGSGQKKEKEVTVETPVETPKVVNSTGAQELDTSGLFHFNANLELDMPSLVLGFEKEKQKRSGRRVKKKEEELEQMKGMYTKAMDYKAASKESQWFSSRLIFKPDNPPNGTILAENPNAHLHPQSIN